ncbi:MAG: hypothetical protein RSE41_06270 [Clostridia bacterium]
MYLNNKGYILVTTLMIFSIISIVCMMCIGLNYSNKSIFNLEYKNIKLKELSFSGIEVASSNILKEVNYAIENSSNEEEFKEYFLQKKVITRISDLSGVDLDNVYTSIAGKILYEEKGYIYFDIISKSLEDNYMKNTKASVKILNPYSKEESLVQGKEDNDEVLKIVDEYENNILININENIDARDLVTIYDYKEI